MATDIAEQNPFLSREDAAKFLCVSPKTLANWACSGRVKIPFSRHGRRIVYRRSDLEAYSLSHRNDMGANA